MSDKFERFKGGVAVITGGGDGIGRALAIAQAEAGVKVAVVDIRENAAQAVAAEINEQGGEAMGFYCDISDLESVQKLAEQLKAQYGQINLLWAHAGVGIGGGFLKASERAVNWLLSVNVWGTLYTLRELVPLLEQHDGPRHIIITASSASLSILDAAQAAYGASKHMSMGIAEGIRGELKDSDIGVSVLCPGLINTRIWDGGRARPERFGGPRHQPEEAGERWRKDGLSPEYVAEKALQGVARGDFYVYAPYHDTQEKLEKRQKEMHEALIKGL